MTTPPEQLATVVRELALARDLAYEQLRIVTDTMAVPVTRCSRDMRYVWASRPYAEWLGLPAHEIVGRPIAEVIGAAAFEQLLPQFERVLLGERVEYEERVDFRGLGPRFVHVVYTPTLDPAGTVDGWVAVVQDVDERRQAEAKLVEEARRKDEFLALLGHELRTPLAPILSAVELLRLQGPRNPDLDWARGVIERQAKHLGRLVDDLLDVSRLSTGRITLRRVSLDLRDVMRDAVETTLPLAETKAQQLVVDSPDDPLPLEGDRVRLGQVLANLLNNASRYTPRGGRLRLAAAREGETAVVRVADDGRGVPTEMLPRIFEMFVRVTDPAAPSEGGLGIGLALARRLVEMHGGTIEARSEGRGRGTELVVRLPLARVAPDELQPVELPQAAPAEAAGRRRVLVVEDHADAADSLARLVAAMGHDVRLARDGEQALELAERRPPDVVLLDVGLPTIDGYQTAARLRAQPGGAALTLIALTGWGQPADKLRATSAGFDHHLTKPADPRVLALLIAASKGRPREA